MGTRLSIHSWFVAGIQILEESHSSYTGRLWTSIPALRKWQSDAPEPESVLQLMRTFIERSGNAPIHVTVLIADLFNDLAEGSQLELPCLDLLASQCHQWKTAILHVDLSIVEKLVPLEAPILDSLNFRCRYPAGWVGSGSYPRLRVLAPHLGKVIGNRIHSCSFPGAKLSLLQDSQMI